MPKRFAFLILLLTLLLGVGGSHSAEAQWWGCKVCSWDTYGQAICVLSESIGPEGGESCRSGLICQGSNCWEVCYTMNPCSWA